MTLAVGRRGDLAPDGGRQSLRRARDRCRVTGSHDGVNLAGFVVSHRRTGGLAAVGLRPAEGRGSELLRLLVAGRVARLALGRILGQKQLPSVLKGCRRAQRPRAFASLARNRLGPRRHHGGRDLAAGRSPQRRRRVLGRRFLVARGTRGASRGLGAAQVARDLLHQEMGDPPEGLEHALALGGHRLEGLDVTLGVELRVELLDGVNLGEIALVVLDHPRDLLELEPVLGQIGAQVGETLLVLLHLADLAVRHEDDGVGALQHQLARGVVEHLPGHGVEQEAGLESHDLAQVERQQIEEQRAIRLRLHADHLAATGLGNRLVDRFEIRGLAAQPGAVIDQLGVDFLARIADDDHGYDPPFATPPCRRA